jgi:hypothetical protein
MSEMCRSIYQTVSGTYSIGNNHRSDWKLTNHSLGKFNQIDQEKLKLNHNSPTNVDHPIILPGVQNPRIRKP